MIHSIIPAIVAVTATLAAALLHRRLRPALAVPALTLFATASALAVIGSLVLLVAGFLGHFTWIANRAAWCSAVAHSHESIPRTAGVAATVALFGSAVSVLHHERRRPRPSVSHPADTEVVVVATDQPAAFAVPGRPGHIVVSVGMIRALDLDERRVLLAHERAHLRHGHHRYIRIADLAAAAVPCLRPISARVRFASERWADEDAAASVGDRSIAARAIARAALAASDKHPSHHRLAIASLGVRARVEALLDDTPQSLAGREIVLAAASVVGVISLAGSTIQLHHVVEFATHLCA